MTNPITKQSLIKWINSMLMLMMMATNRNIIITMPLVLIVMLVIMMVNVIGMELVEILLMAISQQPNLYYENAGNNDGPDDNYAANDQLVQLHANRNGDDGDQSENDNVDGPEPEIHNANDNLDDNDEELDEEFWNNLPKIIDLPKLDGVEFIGNHIKYTKQPKNGLWKKCLPNAIVWYCNGNP
ncbi:hypothetical protein niasHS_007086 [Heterodera schachtii]|uniref:Uncharacterized protein n=1 Tax=Heterodera schachtii TaxID=97005 RepID=A0ABD2JFP3_HETSC